MFYLREYRGSSSTWTCTRRYRTRPSLADPIRLSENSYGNRHCRVSGRHKRVPPPANPSQPGPCLFGSSTPTSWSETRPPASKPVTTFKLNDEIALHLQGRIVTLPKIFKNPLSKISFIVIYAPLPPTPTTTKRKKKFIFFFVGLHVEISLSSG